MLKRSLVSVVDDDESVRESLPDLLREFGFAAQAFSSAEEFLASDYVGQTRCLILDIAMPGMTGPDLQRELMLRRQTIPIVFITAHGDETVRPRLLVLQEERAITVPDVGAGSGHDVDDPTRRASVLCRERHSGDAKFLHHFQTDRHAVAARGLICCCDRAGPKDKAAVGKSAPQSRPRELAV